MKKNTEHKLNSLGYIKAGPDVFTYQIGETLQEAQELFSDSIQSTGRNNVQLVRVDNYKVYPAGFNNLEPNEQKEMIASNRLLPELIEKQIRMLYGTGPALAITRRQGKDVWKEYVEHTVINEWLDSWLERGLADDYKTYFNKCIRSFYYDEGIFSKWRMSQGVRIGVNKVAGLDHVSNLRARLATTGEVINRTDFEDNEFKYVIVCLALFIVGAFISYKLFPHIQRRVLIWGDPWKYGYDQGHQVVQSIISIASGGLFGTGLGLGYPTMVPVVTTDFIFAAICEEMGLLTGFGMLILYFLLFYRCMRVPIHGKDKFSRLLAVGYSTMIASQVLVIVGGVVGAIPLTGITLPLVSYGGSSMIITFFSLGILQKISEDGQSYE